MTRLLSIVTASLMLMAASANIGEVQAGPLDDAKAKGLVGEQADGYLGAIDGNGDVQALIDEINAKRQAKYAEIATKRGAPTEDVAKIAGKKLIERTPKGQFVKGSDGRWVPK
jgi:uncharacterized protein YdbL (DUF1318 family)